MRFKISIFLVFFSVVLRINAQVPEYDRHISRSFHVTDAASVEISNKYGRIQIIPWDKDSVKFNIDLRIRAKDKTKLEKMKQNLDFEFTTSQYFIVARTKFGDAGSDVFKDIVDIAGTYFSASNSVVINYTVMVPAGLSLKIENKFGDLFFDDYTGSLNLSLSYGDFKANRLYGRTDLKITSGDAEINYMKEGLITPSYANLHIREGLRLTVQSLASVVTIEKSGTLKLNSRRDKIYLNAITSLSGESYFSDINIVTLDKEITFSGRYGDISVDNIKRTFTMLNLTSELTDIVLSFEKPLAFDFDLIHYQSVSFFYPKSAAKLSSKVLNAEDKIFSTSGYFTTPASDTKVAIKATRKCTITISEH